GERPLHADAPQLEGTGEIRLESADRASGYWTTRGTDVNARTSGVYVRADSTDLSILDGPDDQKRVELIAERLKNWKSIRGTESPMGRRDECGLRSRRCRTGLLGNVFLGPRQCIVGDLFPPLLGGHEM